MERKTRQMRFNSSQFQVREDGDVLHIEGYFAVFDKPYEMFKDAIETIAKGAFEETIASDDIRALINHDTTLVLGRNTAGTLTLREDEKGLWGDIVINPKDSDAMNCHARVSRGDVSQCSIGFDILDEETEVNGEEVHWTIKRVKLYEVSVCTFPAYEDTSISARQKDFEEIKKRQTEVWKNKMLEKLRGKEEC